MSILKKFGLFLLICLSVFGFVGGIGVAIFAHEWQFTIGIVVLGIAAFNKVREWGKKMME